MAQYASYAENIAPNSVLAVNGKSKTNAGGFKRPALTILNANHPQVLGIKNNPWGTDISSCTTTIPDPRFTIFEDDETMVTSTCNDETEEDKPLNLPECLTKLYSYPEDCKENKDYWSFPDPPQVLTEREIREKKWTAPYRSDVYQYLKGLETRCRPSASYIRRQPDITPNMRSVLVDWLIEVGEEYKLNEETVHLAVTYTDRFLSKMSVLRGKLQLVGTTCMFIAAKHEEIYPPELKDFVYITDNTYTKKQILRMEHLILTMLNFELATPTAFSFLQIYSSIVLAPEKTLLLAQYICEISMLETEPYLMFSPSQIGASCLALANYTLGQGVWPDELASFSGYNLDDIKVIVLCLHERYRSITAYPQQAVREKYKSSKFQCVAEVQCPESFAL